LNEPLGVGEAQVVPRACLEVVQDRYELPLLPEVGRDVRTDETSAACHKPAFLLGDFHGVASLEISIETIQEMIFKK
jgi:hypothetical protein